MQVEQRPRAETDPVTRRSETRVWRRAHKRSLYQEESRQHLFLLGVVVEELFKSEVLSRDPGDGLRLWRRGRARGQELPSTQVIHLRAEWQHESDMGVGKCKGKRWEEREVEMFIAGECTGALFVKRQSKCTTQQPLHCAPASAG